MYDPAVAPVVLWLAALALGSEAEWGFTDEDALRVYGKGLTALRTNKLARAERLFREALDVEPDAGPARFGLAQVLLFQDQAEEACADLSVLGDAHPDRFAIPALRSECLFVLQRFEEAATAGARATELAPGEVDAVNGHVRALLRLGRHDEALGVLSTARKARAGPEWACLEIGVRRDMRQDDRARALLPRCQRADPNHKLRRQAELSLADASSVATAQVTDEATRARVRAAKLAQEGDYEGAIAVLDGVLHDDPADAFARLRRGYLHYRLDRAGPARTDLGTAFDAGTWVEAGGRGSVKGITTQRQEEDLRTLQRNSVALLVALDVAANNLPRAEASRARGVEVLGGGAPLDAAAGLLTHSEDPEAGWAALLAADRGATGHTKVVISLLGALMAERQEGPMPAAAVDWFSATGDWKAAYNQAVAQYNAEQFEACVETVEEALASGTEEAGKFARHGYGCAVYARDWKRADAWFSTPGVALMADPAAVYDHAYARYEGDRQPEAAKMLTLLLTRVQDPKIEVAARELLVHSLVDTGKLDEALRKVDGSTPVAELRLAQELAAAGRAAEARPLLERACPQLSGENAETCRSLLEATAP